MKDFQVLYGEDQYLIGLKYKGLDPKGLDRANVFYGSEAAGNGTVGGACSITFATYVNGQTGAVRGMDLQRSEYCAYEIQVLPGKNVKYATWGLAYTGMDEQTYQGILDNAISAESYSMIPYNCTDAMSFGYNAEGEKSALYCAVLMRSEQTDSNGNLIWTCPGTCPEAETRCCTQSVPMLLATQYVTIDDALKAVGAVDEEYNRIFPDEEPTLDVYSLNIETEDYSYHWFEVVAMEDSTGRHGVLEFVDNYPIWHEDQAYSFNFFLQKDYLYNADGTYKEKYGAGIGRYEATVPYLDQVHTIGDHLTLMDGIRYSFMTYYNEEAGYTGYTGAGGSVDWRSELTGYDVWATYDRYKNTLGLDTSKADAKYPLWANYFNTLTGKVEKIDTFEKWQENADHLEAIYTMNYVLDDENYDETMNFLRWSGAFFNSLTPEEVSLTRSGWETYFRVIADPMNFRVTRWFNECVTTADTIVWSEMVKEK